MRLLVVQGHVNVLFGRLWTFLDAPCLRKQLIWVVYDDVKGLLAWQVSLLLPNRLLRRFDSHSDLTETEVESVAARLSRSQRVVEAVAVASHNQAPMLRLLFVTFRKF